jgi:single-stranded DNA-binding protein
LLSQPGICRIGHHDQSSEEVIIEGQLRRNDWESEGGQIHSKHFLKVESWQFTQYRRQDDSTEAASEKNTKETKNVTSTNKSGREVTEPVCARAYRKSHKSLVLSHAPCRNRTYNPVIKSLWVKGECSREDQDL